MEVGKGSLPVGNLDFMNLIYCKLIVIIMQCTEHYTSMDLVLTCMYLLACEGVREDCLKKVHVA